MRKGKIQKIFAILLATVMCLSMLSFVASAAPVTDNSEIVSPQNIAISDTDKNLTLSSSTLTCYGRTKVTSGYKATTVVTLQKKVSGSWSDLTTWTTNGSLIATVNQTYSAKKSTTYRLKVIHKAYTSSGSLVESFTKYTEEITY